MRAPRPAGRRATRRRRRILLGVAIVVPTLFAVAVFAAIKATTHNPQPAAPAAHNATQSPQRATPGDQPVAPGFTVRTLSGKSFSLADHRGEVVVVEFLAAGCPSCTVDVAGLSKAARWESDAVFLIVDVSGAPNPQVLRDHYRGELGAPPELLIAQDTDFQLVRDYGARDLGHTVVITPDGHLSWQGRWAGDQTLLAAQIREAAGP